MNTIYSFTSCIGQTIFRYLELKIALGRKYSVEYKILKNLDLYLSMRQCDLTAESFVQWCHVHEHLTSGVKRNWMRVTRNLCLYRRRNEPSCFVPDILQFPLPHQSIRPYIFTEDEIIRVLHATKNLNPGTESPIRQENFKLAFILLYTAGLRRGELIRLTIGDYNPAEQTLLIRESKFHKSRLLPLSDDGWKAIETYLATRRRCRLPSTSEFPLIWNCSSNNKRDAGFYSGPGIRSTFQFLFDSANIRTVNGCLPRLHDLRHTFAVQVLLKWYREGINVQSKLPSLSIYMGHVSIVSTQYYLRFIEDVVNSASVRFEKNYGALVTQISKRGDK